MKKDILYITFLLLFYACSRNDKSIIKITETDNVKHQYSCVDMKYIDIYKEIDFLVFEIKLLGLKDTINYSNKSYYHVDIQTLLNDSTQIELAYVCNIEDIVEKRKIVYNYLLENCEVQFTKFIRHPDYSITVYKLDKVCTSINENGLIQFKIKPKEVTEEIINSFKDNLLVSIEYCTKTPSCENTYYIDYLQIGRDSYANVQKRGIDTTNCH